MNIYEGLGQTIAHTFFFSTITLWQPILKQGPDSASVGMDLLPPSNWKKYFLYVWLYLISITALPNRVNFPILQRQKLTMDAVCPVPHTQSVGSRTGSPTHTSSSIPKPQRAEAGGLGQAAPRASLRENHPSRFFHCFWTNIANEASESSHCSVTSVS